MAPVLTLDQLLEHRRTVVTWWVVGLVALAACLLPFVALVLVETFDGPPWPWLVITVLGAFLVLGVPVVPFVEADRRRSARVAREIVAEGTARGLPPAPAAELVVGAGRPGTVTWAGRAVGRVDGAGLAEVVPFGEAIVPPRRQITPGGDQYRWLRLELRGRRYLLMGMTRLHLVDDTGRCWPLPRAAKVDDAAPLRLLLPGDLDGTDVVAVLQALTVFESRVRANQRALSAIS
ncbi:hypothetical protein [Actinomycetospora straminea]|uniref:Uncharacterized protein n=1 Tax=Actinomycetospora straminea TaxID=663607 RepID=A0ABP9F2H0_9PSEU|nr:hypothetical protein [Actinomycetospora straminea]MDD7931686.1 hypothetical protein [Actinomycetospora straminea]